MFHFEYHQPDSLAEVISLLEVHGSDAALLAGGTALMVDMRQGKLHPSHVVSLWGASELRGITGDGDSTLIGALTTASDLVEGFSALPAFKGLSEAALLLGSLQIQNVATIGGNICKASPAADLVPPLLCLDARVLLKSPAGLREVPLEGFLTGPGKTAMRPAEVLTCVRLPAQPAHTATAFLKVMRRRAEDLSIVAVSALVGLEADGLTIGRCRVGLASVAPCPFRSRDAEGILTGHAPDPALLHKAAAAARKEARPISDVRASEDYRRELIEVLVRRAVSAAIQRARGGAGQE